MSPLEQDDWWLVIKTGEMQQFNQAAANLSLTTFKHGEVSM